MSFSVANWLKKTVSRPRGRNKRHATDPTTRSQRFSLEQLEGRIVLADASPFPLVAVTPSSVTQLYGISVDQSVLERWAPTIAFHPQEKNFPVSIEYLLQNSDLWQRDPAFLPPNPVTKFMDEIPSTLIKAAPLAPQDLAPYRGDSYWLDIHAVAFPGNDGFGAPSAINPIVAPQYVTVIIAPDGSYVDLNYFSVYAFNSYQTAGFHASFHSDFSGGADIDLSTELDIQIKPFASHEGDIDTFVTLRLTPELDRVIWVKLQGHGTNSFYLPQEMFWEGTHVVVAAALNSRASMNPADPSWVDGFQVLKGISPAQGVASGSESVLIGTINWRASFIGGFGDYFSTAGFMWRPGANGRVALVDHADPSAWINFEGRVGVSEKVDIGGLALESFGGGSSVKMLEWLDDVSEALDDIDFLDVWPSINLKQLTANKIAEALAGKEGDTPANPNSKLHLDGPHLPRFDDQSPGNYVQTGKFVIVSATDSVPHVLTSAGAGPRVAQLYLPDYPEFQTWTLHRLTRGVDDSKYTVYALYNEHTQNFLVGQNLVPAADLGIDPITLGSDPLAQNVTYSNGLAMTWKLSASGALTDNKTATTLTNRNGSITLNVAGRTQWRLEPVKPAGLDANSAETAQFLERRGTEITSLGTRGQAEFGQPGFIQGLVRPTAHIGHDLSFEYPVGSPWKFGKYEGASIIPKEDYERRDSDQSSKAGVLRQSASLTGYGSMSQTIHFNGNSTSYVIRALLASGPMQRQRVAVFVDDRVVGILERPETDFGEVTTMSFKATRGPHKITFQGVPLSGNLEASALIDNIEILALPNMVQDPGFEESPYRVTPWTFHGQLPPGDGAYLIPPPFEGANNVAGLGFTGSISQPVFFPVAGTYQLLFWTAFTNRNPSDHTVPTAPLRVTYGGKLIGDAFAISENWKHHSVEFVVTAPGTYDLEFGHRTGVRSSVDVALFIDNVFLALVSRHVLPSTQGFASGISHDVWKHPISTVSITDGVDTIVVPVTRSVATGHGVFKISIPANHPFLSSEGEKKLVVTYHGDGRDFGSAAPYQLTVRDTTAPTFSPPMTDKSVEATSSAGAFVTYEATATDAGDASPTVDCDVASGSLFPIGTTTVTCTATDESNNSVTESFLVTVADDTTGPTIDRIDLVRDTKGKVRELVLTFSEPLSRSGAESLANYSLEARARRRSKPIPLASAIYNASTVTLRLVKPIAAKKLAPVFLTARGSASLTDNSYNFNQLDGDNNSTPGGDFVRSLLQGAPFSVLDRLELW